MVTNFRLLNGSVFSAMKTDINNRNQADLAAEEERDRVKNLNNAAALVGENKFLVSDKPLGSGNGSVVLFDDPKTKQRVALSLDEANLKKLKGAFGSEDFYERKDGTIRLNGKAESFVSGWFGDIAYKQGYLEADSNKDGVISGKEKDALKTGAGSTGAFDGTTAVDEALISYIKGGDNSFGTIQDALNAILAKDKNLDGNLERLGEYQSEEEAKQWTMKAIQRAMGNGLGGFGNIMDSVMDDILADDFSGEFITDMMNKMFENNKKLTDNIKKMMEEYRKRLMEKREKGETLEGEKSLQEIQTQQKALQTLKNNGGDMNALNAEEKKSLTNLTQKDNLNEKEMQDLQKQVDANSFKVISEAIGVNKEDLQRVFKNSLDESDTSNNNLLEVDKGLISVIDSIRTQVRNGDVSLFEKMA